MSHVHPDHQPPLVIVAAALVDAEGRILVQKRPANKQMGGLWEFPGGKIEPGETATTALARELEEELGISVPPNALDPLTFASEALGDRQLVLLLYLCLVWEGTPVALEADEVRWLPALQLSTLEMPLADRPLVTVLEKLSRSGQLV